MIFNFWNFHLTSLIKFSVTRPSPMVLSHKKDGVYPNYNLFYNVIEIVVWDNFLCKIIYGRVGVFLFSKFGASNKGQIIIFYFRNFAESWNEFVLTIKTKGVFWFWVSVKPVIMNTTKSGKNMVQFLMNFRRHFFRDYFLCVDDRSENDLL